MFTAHLIVTLRPASRIALVVSVMLASFQLLAQGKERPVEHPTFYRTIQIDGLSIFYREAGRKDAKWQLLETDESHGGNLPTFAGQNYMHSTLMMSRLALLG